MTTILKRAWNFQIPTTLYPSWTKSLVHRRKRSGKSIFQKTSDCTFSVRTRGPLWLVLLLMMLKISLTKLLLPLDLPLSTVTNQIAYVQRNLHLTPEFERAMDSFCETLVSKLKTLGNRTIYDSKHHPHFTAGDKDLELLCSSAKPVMQR